MIFTKKQTNIFDWFFNLDKSNIYHVVFLFPCFAWFYMLNTFFVTCFCTCIFFFLFLFILSSVYLLSIVKRIFLLFFFVYLISIYSEKRKQKKKFSWDKHEWMINSSFIFFCFLFLFFWYLYVVKWEDIFEKDK